MLTASFFPAFQEYLKLKVKGLFEKVLVCTATMSTQEERRLAKKRPFRLLTFVAGPCGISFRSFRASSHAVPRNRDDDLNSAYGSLLRCLAERETETLGTSDLATLFDLYRRERLIDNLSASTW